MNKRHLERLFDDYAVLDLDFESYKSPFSDGWVNYRAFSETLMIQYLRFDNEKIGVLANGIFMVGIIPLIDEATGFQDILDVKIQVLFNRFYNEHAR